MKYKVNGITLFGVNYKESDKILTIFTIESGKIGAAARGVRKANAKLRQIAEPFCFAEIVVNESSGRKTITEITPFDSFYPIRTDIKKYYSGMCALEFTDAFLPEGLVDEEYFALLVEFCKKLAYSTINPVNLLLKFLLDAADESGFALNLSFCGRCESSIKNKVFLAYKDGFCVCEDCRREGDLGFSIDTYAFLREISLGNTDCGDDKLRKNGLKFFAYYIEKVAGITFKSLPELIAFC